MLYLEEGFPHKELPEDATAAPDVDSRAVSLLAQKHLRGSGESTGLFWYVLVI